MKRTLRWRPRRGDWVFALTAGVLVVNAVRYRRRVARLARVDSLHASAQPEDDRTFELIAVEGVSVPPEALAAAMRYARSEQLDVLDIVPGDLDAERVIELARFLNPATYRAARFAFGRGANQAILIERSTLARAGGRPCGQVFEADLARLLEEAKRCAPLSTDVAVVTGAHAGLESPARRRAALRASFRNYANFVIWLPPACVAALLVGVVLAPVWGTAALVAYLAQPSFVVGPTPLAGGDTTRSALRARFSAMRRLARTAAAPDISPPDVDPDHLDRMRAAYAELLANGTDCFFEPRRATCPWCGGDALEHWVTSDDILLRKPGEFTLDRCCACGHVFQNPRLSLAGLDFYYRDAYDGEGEADTDFTFQMSSFLYGARAEFARHHMETPPARWLDVGAGHGHFCLYLAGVFEQTAFEALDMSDAMRTVERRGWVERVHQGLFPDLAPQLEARYDMVSMSHYLEHTREPKDELRAARRVLRPDGYLLIEVPDGECVAGRVLGRWWSQWVQPQHLHFVPVSNLRAALDAEGFDTVAVERGKAHLPADMALAVGLLLDHLGPPVGRPWMPPTGRGARLRRNVVFTVGAPALALSFLLDQVTAPVVRRLPGGPNAYRLLARKRA
jgi:SAM-dependent methyltransferase